MLSSLLMTNITLGLSRVCIIKLYRKLFSVLSYVRTRVFGNAQIPAQGPGRGMSNFDVNQLR